MFVELLVIYLSKVRIFITFISVKIIFIAYCWVGAIVKQQLEKEPKIEHSIKECEELWADLKMKSKQKRFFKSQVEQREKAQAAAEGGEVEEEEEDEPEPVDMFEMLPETKILPTLSTKFKFEDEEIVFYDGMESKKWKVRGACLDLLNKSLGLDIASLPDEIEKLPEVKLAAGDYGNLATALKTCIKKDTNVLLLIKVFVGTALLAKALRDKFKNYATQIIIEILGRFKEKKPNVSPKCPLLPRLSLFLGGKSRKNGCRFGSKDNKISRPVARYFDRKASR